MVKKLLKFLTGRVVITGALILGFDWKLAENFPRPCFIAGGLGAENAAEVMEKLRPFALDMSSGVETDGFKDLEKIKAAVAAVRRFS